MAIKKAIVLSDLHAPFHDVESLASIRKFLKDFQPDYLVINGDVFDFYGISSFGKNPLRTQGGLQRELDIGFIMLQWLLEPLENTKVHFVEGNHEERWNRFLLSDQNLFTLRALNLEENLRVKELGIKYHKASLVLHNLLIKHGTFCNIHTAWKEITEEGSSGTSGHIHRVQLVGRTYRDRQNIWCSTGHLSNESQMDYTQPGKKATNHQQSFNIYFFDTNRDIIQPIPIIIVEHMFIYEGKLYRPETRHLKDYEVAFDSLPDLEEYYQ